MIGFIKNELYGFGIKNVAAIPLSFCKVIRPYKLEKCGFKNFDTLSAVIFTIPYLAPTDEKNVSSYAVARDYHLFCKELFDAIIPKLRQRFRSNNFAGFADNSPIDEVRAAAMSGLGIIGDNGLLITHEHSSYVFIGEIITDTPLTTPEKYEIRHCEGCGKCSLACPKGECGECLSEITQKKGELSQSDINAIKKHGTAWGCDICSEVCPHTKRAIERGTIYTDIPFFRENLTPKLSKDSIKNMSEEEFCRRAYSWRKKETILRNLEILED
ncbi:MAG: epoxyqueuosine reductase [Clostridia bacterium]|nr:epoxyqueuosine reductase [Clostridia bacterium]